jgi:acyl transferase domain-containing protein/NADP-dependent 3-hydroxy acid dehydrogenase YdfG/acyl carrier protein
VSVDGPPTRARLLELAALYVSGREIAWSSLHARPVRRIQLPVYPFTLERFWADPPERGEPETVRVRPVEAAPPVSPAVEEMLFAPVWREAPMTSDPTSPPLGPVLVVDSGDGLVRAIAERYPDLTLLRSQPTGETEYADLIATQAPRVILVRAQEGVIGIEEVYRLARALVSSPGSRPVRLILVLSSEAPPALAAIPAFLATLAQERPGIRVLSLTLDDDRAVADELFFDDPAREVRRCAGGREIRTLEAHPLGAVGLGFREAGVCLISGGAGGLGWILSRHLVETYRARLVWIGRSEPDARLRARIQELAALGGQVLYVRGDVGREEDVQSAVRLARERFGAIHAVIHAAGVIHNNFLIKKELGEFRRVLAPKLLGAMHLDAVLKDEPLDAFVLFSSVAGILPEPGQGDYAYANRFLDEFAVWREGLRARGLRHGRSLAIDWQMWRDGGMATGAEAAEQTERQSGLPALESASGLRLLERALGSAGLVSGLCCLGRRDRVVERIARVQANPAFSSRPPASSDQPPAASSLAESWKPEADAQQQIEQFVKQQVAELFKVPLDQFEMERPFAEYGLDSILVTRFNARITELIPEVSRTLLFEFPHARALSAHLLSAHRAELESLFAAVPVAQEQPEPAEARTAAIEDSPSVHTVPEVQSAPQPDSTDATEIAIIGLAGRYPQAPDLATFWDNLSHGRDCIREVPPERWDAESCHDPDPARAAEGKIYCKWGGFLDGVDRFDPGFFSMAPVEAETLDPQTRLFLQTAWHALEDAGYARSRLLAWHRREERARVGVFAGVTQNSYQLLGVMRNLETRTRVDQSGEWSLANHVSYFFDFSGPSLPVDTACSSSLTAIHLACESLRRGECDLALAGGVNLHLHPIKYASACALGMLSPSGRCHSFGADGDGYVPGEGVGVVILKPLAQARRDGDHIYGVIKASAVNHGGRTNGFTVPSPAAQGAVVSQALRQAGIDPRTIGYVEAHGTGTRLGDPIEVDGLTRAFTSGRDAGASGWCALGSVKSNIGHLEAAAGIAGLTKILLQFRHRTLVPTLNAERPNPDIDFSRTPFVLQRELRDWVVPEGQPRRAGLSSFGAGGTNAHLIVEEYRMEPPKDQSLVTTAGSEWLIPLSARGETELRNAVGNLLGYLWSPDAEADLSALAYTLQVARAELAERVAFVVGDLEALKRRLAAFLDSEQTEAIRGRAGQERVAIDPVAIDRMDLRAIARAWVTGAEIDWRVLHPGDVPHRVPQLPGYPFLADRYWYGSFVSGKATADRPAPAPIAEPPAAKTVVDTTHWRASAGHFEARPEVRMERLDAGILVVRMEDHANRNMFTEALLHGLMHCFDQVERDPSVRVVVVTGCDKVFSMGGTREELLTLTGNVATFADMEFIFKGFLQCRVPVIAAIQGHASGGGLVFGLYADMVVMAEEGLYSAVFTKYGFTPGLGATLILPDKLGGALAVEMMMTAATYRGADLKQRGANVLFQPQTRVLDEAIALARSLTRIPDYTLRTLKDSLAREKLARLPAVIAEELRMHGETFGHPEVKARISRFFRDDGEDQGDEDADLKETAGDESSAMDAAVPAVEPPPPAIASGKTVPAVEAGDLRRTMALSLCDKLHIEPGTLDRRMSFRDLGLDSITGVEFIHEVNRTFGLGLDASIVYDLTHFDALADHVASLVETATKPATTTPPAAKPPSAPARLQLRDVRADPPSPPAEARMPIRLSPVGTAVAPNATPTPEPGREPNASRATEPQRTRPGEMAIIGLSCRLPGAPDLDTFWRHLAQGVDSVSVVPRDRFDVERLFDPDPEAIDKTYCKWGGFIDEVDRFDPLFFNLSHAEAEVMDPQQRLFLEEAWKAFEHAGYCSRSLNGSRCGLFVGAATGEYGAVLKRENPELFHTAFAGMGLTPSIMVARISYLLNLKGPSMALDTACSSSLVALHQACRSLEVGDCDLALAGGINLILEPDQLVTTSKLRMLSPTGRCRPFDHRADGIALSEGVAMVIVKRLDEALRDGDHIYGVIEATGINQDGKTNGITSPSATSQTELQRRVLERAGVNPEWIGLMEGHGTGTRLGDPVEVRGLNETFRAYTQKRGFCALGSVKSNIGHTSFASGLAGLIKVLLSFEHERIPPTLHFERPNEEIRFEDSPFFVNTEPREWRRTPGRPRYAAVSSFGYSGTNAYAVLADFDDGGRAESVDGPELIVLSAKTRAALDESVARLHDRLDPSGTTFRANLRLDDLAFTLQTGRDALEFRLAWIVGGLDALRQRLAEARRGDLSHAYQGLPVRDSGRMPVAAERQAALETDAETELPRLARAWVEGAEIDWTPLWRSRSARRTALPTYPFARERCWVQPAAQDRARTDVGVQSSSPRPLPAGREPERLPTDDSISIPLAADDPRLLGHRVKGRVTVSGALMLELVAAVIAEARGGAADAVEFEQVVWLEPLVAENGVDLRVRLDSEPGGTLSFQILAGATPSVTHAEGRARIDRARTPERVDPSAWPAPGPHCQSGDELYAWLAQAGLDYRDDYRVIEDIQWGDDRAVARLRLPAGMDARKALNCFLLDGALQAASVLAAASGGATAVPFAIDRLWCSGSSTPVLVEVRRGVRRGDIQTFDLRLFDQDGLARLEIQGFGIRASGPPATPIYLRPHWERRERPDTQVGDSGGVGRLLLFGDDDGLDGELRAAWPRLEIQRVNGSLYPAAGRRSDGPSSGESRSDEASLERLLETTAPDYILYRLKPTSDDPSGAFESLFPLSKALVRQGLTKPVTVLCLGSDASDPAFMALGAFGRTVAQEQPLLRIKTLATGSADVSRLREIVAELW